MRIQLFGSISAIDADGHEVSLGGPKQRTVLAMLCVEPGRPVSADRLISSVWGDSVPERAARSLSTYLSSLRREMGDTIESSGGSHTLHLDRSQIDVCAFIDAVHTAENADGYRKALALWSGTPFEGLDGFGAFRDDIQRLDGSFGNVAPSIVVRHASAFTPSKRVNDGSNSTGQRLDHRQRSPPRSRSRSGYQS